MDWIYSCIVTILLNIVACLMTKHTDPSKFYSSGIEMSCPPLLIWKQNKCYCDYPGPGDQTLTISTTDSK